MRLSDDVHVKKTVTAFNQSDERLFDIMEREEAGHSPTANVNIEAHIQTTKTGNHSIALALN